MKDKLENLTESPLYSEHLAPVPQEKRTWSLWNLTAIWIGMAVCIPTYILASYMIKSGLSWQAALIIIGLANLIITVPMVLNGHAGVKYGIPFPVIGRASFGTKGIHIAAVVRAVVACGWFGIQTWIGGLAFYAIWNAVTGSEGSLGLDTGKFIGFGLFWLVNLYFIWNGTESIKWLESFAAPILILMGFLLIIWGSYEAGGFGKVLKHGEQLQESGAYLTSKNNDLAVHINPLKSINGGYNADEFQISIPHNSGSMISFDWRQINPLSMVTVLQGLDLDMRGLKNDKKTINVQFRQINGSRVNKSSIIKLGIKDIKDADNSVNIWSYILWLTAMVGFWATMSLSIADITRYARTQKAQAAGQFIGLPGSMVLYSFIGIFVTFAAAANFSDIMIQQDAPWDPVSLLARFENPVVVIAAQIFMIIATLSTNIAANVIAPANAFANLYPRKIDFKHGGLITGIIGILIAPWWLLDEISGFLIFVSGLLGPVLGIMLCDYFIIRKRRFSLAAFYKTDGEYSYKSGFNPAAIAALFIGVLTALIGYWVPALDFLYKLSWFSGFIIAFVLYYFLFPKSLNETAQAPDPAD